MTKKLPEPEYIEVEGDKPKVERTRQHFAALRAGLKTAEEKSYEIQRLVEERDNWHAAFYAEHSLAQQLRNRAERAEAALRWYDDHKSHEGFYDGLLFGDLRAVQTASNPAKEPS